MIDDIKKLTLQEIKELYCDYLLSQNLSKNTIHTCCTDAFYLYRNDNTIDFLSQQILKIEVKKDLTIVQKDFLID